MTPPMAIAAESGWSLVTKMATAAAIPVAATASRRAFLDGPGSFGMAIVPCIVSISSV